MLQDEGAIERIGRGIYRRTDAEIADLDLLEIAIKTPKATLCLTSALAQHDLTDTIPSVIDIALPRGEWQPITSASVRWHKFAISTFDIGRLMLEHGGGGHEAAGTCQVENERSDEVVAEIVETIAAAERLTV